MIRIYPIRTTKSKWNIFFYSKHQCSSKCEYFIENDENLELSILKNPEFKEGFCKLNNVIEKTGIRLSTFDKDNPCGSSGPLLNYDEEVIPEDESTVSIENIEDEDDDSEEDDDEEDDDSEEDEEDDKRGPARAP